MRCKAIFVYSIAALVPLIILTTACKSIYSESSNNTYQETPNTSALPSVFETHSFTLKPNDSTMPEDEVIPSYPEGIYDDWENLPYENMPLVDDNAYTFLKTVYGSVDYYGEFNKGDNENYNYYLGKYLELIANEVPFIEQSSGNEIYLSHYYGYFDDDRGFKDHLDSKEFYYFDFDDDGIPEMCIASECIFKYYADLDRCVLWEGFEGNFYYSITGSRKMTWDHGTASWILHEYYEMDMLGNLECSTFTYLHLRYDDTNDESIIYYMATIPRNEKAAVPDEVLKQAYIVRYEDGSVDYCYRLTESQYSEITRDYFAAREQAEVKIVDVSFSYDELFASFCACPLP